MPTESGFRLHLDEPMYGAAPGQAAVLYEDDVVVGAGTIATSGPARTFQLNGA
jgi:tRNA U34 2-thiouridine synthase MnmA/TrmU